MRALLFALLLAAGLAQAQPIQRNRAEVRAFRAENPCPSTGRTRGPCAGHQVDHTVSYQVGKRDAEYAKRLDGPWLALSP